MIEEKRSKKAEMELDPTPSTSEVSKLSKAAVLCK